MRKAVLLSICFQIKVHRGMSEHQEGMIDSDFFRPPSPHIFGRASQLFSDIS